MKLTCPHCGFARETDPARIPPGATEVTCPRCREKFPLVEGSDRPIPPSEEPAIVPSPEPMDLPFAGFWIRVGAMLVDSVAVTLLQFVLGFLLSMAISTLIELDDTAMEFVIGLFGTAIGIAYYVYFTGYGGQTPGKMALKLRVIRTDGTGIGYRRAFLREVVGKFLSGILLGIGYLMVGFDRKKQGLHDRIADTYVIRL